MGGNLPDYKYPVGFAFGMLLNSKVVLEEVSNYGNYILNVFTVTCIVFEQYTSRR